MPKRAVSAREIAVAIEDSLRFDANWGELLVDAVRKGLIEDTGERDEDGRVIWRRT